MKISSVDIENCVVLLKSDDELIRIQLEDFNKFAQLLEKFGAKKVIFLSKGLNLETLSDEELKKVGLKRI
jgi:hypothetical protein